MKNIFKFLGVAALALVIAFAMTACSLLDLGGADGDGADNSTGNSNNKGSGNNTDNGNNKGSGSNTDNDNGASWKTLTLSGKVYMRDDSDELVAYTGDELLVTDKSYSLEKKNEYSFDTSDDFLKYLADSAEGKVKNGNLSFTNTKKQKPAYLENIYGIFKGLFNVNIDYDNIKISSNAVQAYVFDGLLCISEDFSDGFELIKQNSKTERKDAGSTTEYSETTETIETVMYLYVDKAVTISGKGKITDTKKTSNFSIALKAGWNAVYQNISEKCLEKRQLFIDEENNEHEVVTERKIIETNTTISLGDHDLKWVLVEEPVCYDKH